MTDPDESVLEKVRKLLAMAERGATEDERDNALALADRLMTKHAIDQAMLAASAPSKQIAPIARRIRLYEYSNEFHEQFISLVISLARHYRVRAVRHIDVIGEYTVVGYSADIEYFELVWTQVYLAFIARMAPTWDPAETEDANIYRLKMAGVKWIKIAEMAGMDWPEGGRLKRAVRRECVRRDEEYVPHTQRHDAYRQSYAEAFIARIDERTARQVEVRNATVSATPGAEVALRDRSAFVDDLVYKLFPSLRPATAEELARYREADERERAELAAKLEAMTSAERARFAARQAAEQARWAREWAKAERARARLHDVAGATAGRNAADSVDLSVGKPVGRVKRPELD